MYIYTILYSVHTYTVVKEICLMTKDMNPGGCANKVISTSNSEAF